MLPSGGLCIYGRRADKVDVYMSTYIHLFMLASWGLPKLFPFLRLPVMPSALFGDMLVEFGTDLLGPETRSDLYRAFLLSNEWL